jgi:predicted phage replisome organizer
MADVKWIKIVVNVFDDEKIRYIETLPNGDETIVIWFRILCLAGKSNSSGLLMMTDRIAYTDDMLSSIFKRDIKSIQLALNTFLKLGMIEMIEDKIYIANWDKHQSLEKLEQKKLYDREYQKKKREGMLLDNRTTIVRANNDNRVLDIELELDKEKDIKDKNNRRNFIPPTLDELTDFIQSSGYKVNAETFLSHYESKGWYVGKNKMKDWKAAVRGWNAREKDKPISKSDREDILPEYEPKYEKPIVTDSIDRKNLIEKIRGNK